MKNSNNNFYNNTFSHVYIEEQILTHPRTKAILTKLPNVTQIMINHYKDVFCRTKQNFCSQKNAPALILAKKENNLIYKGAKVCQSFGNENFFYTSCIMNCIYNCEYCYLQGMYSSANIVVFVNLEDIFLEVKQLTLQNPIYLCVSYDTDMLALENLLGYGAEWINFCEKTPNLTIELRTKSANFSSISCFTAKTNVILAWTVSPEEIAEKYEHKASPIKQRIRSIEQAISAGWKVRICFDPMITFPNWKEVYSCFIQKLFSELDATSLFDVSIGLFRVSKDYLKRMRSQNPNSIVLSYPYTLNNGVYEYQSNLGQEMITFIHEQLTQYIDSNRIFNWENEN